MENLVDNSAVLYTCELYDHLNWHVNMQTDFLRARMCILSETTIISGPFNSLCQPYVLLVISLFVTLFFSPILVLNAQFPRHCL